MLIRLPLVLLTSLTLFAHSPTAAAAQSGGILVTPDGDATPAKNADTGPWVAAFTIQNTSSERRTVDLSCDADGALCVTVSADQITLAPGFSHDVWVVYRVAEARPGQGARRDRSITLSAADAGGNDAGSWLIPVSTEAASIECEPDCIPGDDPDVDVTPDNANAGNFYANSTGHTRVFTVTNPTLDTWTYALTCSASNATCTNLSKSSTTLNAGQSTTVTATYSAGSSPGTGSVYVQARETTQHVTDNGSVNFSVIVPTAVVTGPSGTTKATSSSGTAVFQVQNTGSTTETFDYTCLATGPVNCGTVSPVSHNIGAGQFGIPDVSVNYTTTGTPGTGTITLQARNPPTGLVYTDDASITVVLYSVSVVADGGSTAPEHLANTGGHSETFTVTNTGSGTNTFSFVCSESSNVTCGNPSNVTLGAGASTTVTANYSVQGTGASSWIRLTASGSGGATDNAQVNFPVNAYGATVTPLSGTPEHYVNTGTHSYNFRITNTGNTQNTYTFSPSCSGLTGCTTPGQVTLAAGAQTTVTVNYSTTSSTGVKTIQLTAFGQGGGGTNHSGNGSVSVIGVDFSVDPPPATTQPTNTPNLRAQFLLTNTGPTETVVTLGCVPNGGVTSCVTDDAQMTLPPGAIPVAQWVTYGTGSANSNSGMTLTANSGGASTSGTASVNVVRYGVTTTSQIGPTGPAVDENTSGHSIAFTVTNTGSQSESFDFTCTESGTVTCPNPTSQTIGAGASATVTANFSVGGSDANAWIRLQADGPGGASANDQVNFVINGFGVSVSAVGSSQQHWVGESGGSYSFQVTNQGTQPDDISFTASCSGMPNCVAPDPVNGLAGGATTTVDVDYDIPTNTGSYPVTLTANAVGGGGSSDNASGTAVVSEPAFTLTSTSGSSASVGTGGSGTHYFEVINNDPGVRDYFPSCIDADGVGVTSCTITSTNPIEDVAGTPTLDPRTVEVTFNAGSTATSSGSFTLRVSDDLGGIREIVVPVTVIQYGAEVTSSYAAPVGMTTNWPEQTHQFWVKNIGSQSIQYSFTCPVSSNLTMTSCPAPITVAQGDSTEVSMTYVPSGINANSWITLEASAGGRTDSDTVNFSVDDPGPPAGTFDIVPDAPSALRQQNEGTFEVVFTVTNNGPSAEINVDCIPGGNAACAGIVGPTTQNLDNGASVDVAVQYTTGAVGTGTITLDLWTTNLANEQGSQSIQIENFDASVGGGSLTVASNGSGVGVFEVVNIGTYQAEYRFDCSQSGEVFCTETPLSTVVPTGDTVLVSVPFQSGALGTGSQLNLHVSAVEHPGLDRTGSIAVAVEDHGVVLDPDEKTVGVLAGSTGSQDLTVRNIGSTTSTFDVSISCTGQLSGCPTFAQVSVDPGQSAVVNVPYTVGNGGPGATGVITATATEVGQSGVSDNVQITATIGTPMAPTVSLTDASAAPTVARGACVTAAAGPAAVECGDLRYGYALPPITTLGKVRAPILTYNSRHAEPQLVIPANVLLPTGGVTPDQVEAILDIDGTTTTTWFDGGEWGPGRAARIAVDYDASGVTADLLDYSLEVAFHIGGTRYPNVTTQSGQVAVLPRMSTDNELLGVSGWWIAGVESIRFVGDTIVWHGGDGSVRIYEQVANRKWAAQSLVRPDTIRKVGKDYEREVSGGVTIEYDKDGRHIATTNRLGETTNFSYNGTRLDEITVPTRSGSIVGWRFHYSNGGSQLDSVVAVPNDATNRRTVQVTRSGGRIVALTDADLYPIDFGYGASDRIESITDKRLTVHSFSYDASGSVISATTDMEPQFVDVTTTYVSAESRGYGVAVDTAFAFALIDGPRSDVGDTTRIWVNRYGAPDRISDPFGAITTLERTDSRFPLAVTKTTAPNGLISDATYDNRGNVLTSSVIADGTTATTTYEWDPLWDTPTKVTLPEGEVTETDYDSGNGNVLWQQDARGTVSRTTFAYNNFDHLESVTDPLGHTTQLEYDTSLGNLHRTTTPLGFETVVHRDGLGRDSVTVTPIDGAVTNTLSTYYDAIGRVDSTYTFGPALGQALPETLIVRNVYDEGGNVMFVHREASPDPLTLGVETTSMTYDNAGRTLTSSEPSRTTSYTYDPAGNVVTSTTSNGTLRMAYDAAGRLTRRLTPDNTYAGSNCAADCPWNYGVVDLPWIFPLFPNDGSDGLIVRGDVATFTYDVMGNQLTANNQFARITRTYTDRGQIETDESRLREIDEPDFSSYVYQLSYTYDLNGRRKTLDHPSNLVQGGPSQPTQSYAYNSIGMVDTVTSVLGHEYTFTYDERGSLQTYSFPSGSESHTYDDDGRRLTRSESVLGSTLHSETFTYDQRGRITDVSIGGAMGGSVLTRYSGLGAVVESDVNNNATGVNFHEQFTVDALGRTVTRDMYNAGAWDFSSGEYSYTYVNGAVQDIIHEEPPQGWQGDNPKVDERWFDSSGNVRTSVERQEFEEQFTAEDLWVSYVGARNYYGADEKLRVRQVYRDSVNVEGAIQATGKREGTYEEYWYDALGRRVLLRTRGSGDAHTDALCWPTQAFVHCYDAQERFVWDGNQLLYEDRVAEPGSNSAPAFHEQYGTVGYTHGGALDQPLDLMKGSDVVVLHTDWRGQFDSGTEPDGTQFGCQPDGTVNNCEELDWAGGNITTFLKPGNRNEPNHWYGSLISGSRDQSGLVYMRNRYYDPSSGQFTQTDPIGIAGGLNTYGYANGDPVNFSDPFGLMADTLDAGMREALGDLCDKVDCDVVDVVTDGPMHAAVMKAAGAATRGVTLGNTVYLRSDPDPTNREDVALVAHELAHVGQYQERGAIGYYAAALSDRHYALFTGNPYLWQTPRRMAPGYAGSATWGHYSMEQQGRIVQDCYLGLATACSLSPYSR